MKHHPKRISGRSNRTALVRSASAFTAESLERRTFLSAAGLVTFHPGTNAPLVSSVPATTAPAVVVKTAGAPTTNGVAVEAVDLTLTSSAAFFATAGEFPGNIVYDYTVTNLSDSVTATNVSVDFTFSTPSGVDFDSSALDGNDNYSGNESNGTWTVASIAPGGAASLTLTFTANSDAQDGASFTADAIIDSADPSLINFGDDFTSDSTLIERKTDLELNMMVDNSNPAPGSNVEFTIDLTSFGPSDADSVQVTDLLPAGLTFVSADTAGFGTYDETNGIWDIGTVTSSDLPELKITATVDQGTADTTITNNAEVTQSDSPDDSPATASADVNPVDATTTPVLTIGVTDLVDSAKPGDTLTYIVSVANPGNADATGVVLTETLPAGTTFSAADSADWTRVGTTDQYTFDLGTLEQGHINSVDFTVKVKNPAAATQTTIVDNVSVGHDGVAEDATTTDTDDLDASIDLKVDVTDSGATFAPGSTILYSVTYSNHGNQNAGQSFVSINVPAHTTFVPASSDPNWVKAANVNVYTITLDHINAGDAPKTATFAVKVDATLPAGTTSTSATSFISGGTESSLNDNNSTRTTQLGTTAEQATAILTTDPCDPTKTAVIATGTEGKDTITFTKSNNKISVKIGSKTFGPFSPTGSLIAYGLGGDDTITGPSSGTFVFFAFGGQGKDTIKGGAGYSVIVGGDDADTITGSDRRAILIGGRGADKITGGLSDDIVIGGTTTYDTNINALCEIRDEWFRTDKDYGRRVGHITGTDPDGKNQNVFLSTATVFDDGSADTLKGKGGSDLFFTTESSPKKSTDDTDDKSSSETRIVLSSAVATT